MSDQEIMKFLKINTKYGIEILYQQLEKKADVVRFVANYMIEEMYSGFDKSIKSTIQKYYFGGGAFCFEYWIDTKDEPRLEVYKVTNVMFDQYLEIPKNTDELSMYLIAEGVIDHILGQSVKIEESQQYSVSEESQPLAEICHKALQLQGWVIDPIELEQIIATYQRVEKLGTAFSLKDAAEIEAKFLAKKENRT